MRPQQGLMVRDRRCKASSGDGALSIAAFAAASLSLGLLGRPRLLTMRIDALGLIRTSRWLARPWLWLRFHHRQIGALPAIGSVGIPGDVGIAVAQNTLGRVPRHPAIGLAIHHDQPCAIAPGCMLQSLPQISFGGFRKLTVT